VNQRSNETGCLITLLSLEQGVVVSRKFFAITVGSLLTIVFSSTPYTQLNIIPNISEHYHYKDKQRKHAKNKSCREWEIYCCNFFVCSEALTFVNLSKYSVHNTSGMEVAHLLTLPSFCRHVWNMLSDFRVCFSSLYSPHCSILILCICGTFFKWKNTFKICDIKLVTCKKETYCITERSRIYLRIKHLNRFKTG
jgi:hypothetical protein